MTGQVLVESMDLSAHRLSVKTSVEDESERADSTLSRWDRSNSYFWTQQLPSVV